MSDLTNLITTHIGHEDERRKIVDITSKIKFFQIKDQEGIKLANHYHKKSEETFYIIDGTVIFKLEDVNSEERKEYILGKNSSIKIPIFVAHLLLPTPKAQFFGILENDFDPDDLNKYNIKW